MKKMKDDSMDRLLRRTAGTASDAAAPGACLDADVLAALSDGSLTAVERASAESHAAACDRCFAVLSAIARTAPAAHAPPSQKQAAWLSLRWMLPLASAAVIVTAFALQLQLQRPSEVPAPPAAPAPVPAQPTVRANENAAAANAEQKPSARAAMPEVAKDSAAGAAPSQPQRRDQEAAALLRKAQPQEPAALGAAAEKKLAERQAALDEVQQKPSAAPAPPPPAAAAAAARPPAVAETVAVDRNERARSDMRALQQQIPIILPTPDPNVRWRVNGRAIERSIDAGQTWSGAVTRTDRDVLAGACAAANVCWFAGRSGLVLLTTDGTTWHTISPPEASLDLVSLTATSALAATITAANGRTYRTTDGGRTWTVN